MKRVMCLLVCLGLLVIGSDAFARYYMPLPANNPNVQFFSSSDGRAMYMENMGNEPVFVLVCVQTSQNCNRFQINPTGCNMVDPRKATTPEGFFKAASKWQGVILWPGGQHHLWLRVCSGTAHHNYGAAFYKMFEEGSEAEQGFLRNIRQYKSHWNFSRQFNSERFE